MLISSEKSFLLYRFPVGQETQKASHECSREYGNTKKRAVETLRKDPSPNETALGEENAKRVEGQGPEGGFTPLVPLGSRFFFFLWLTP